MALTKEVYRALEEIVGAKYISEEPATLDAYSWQPDNVINSPDCEPFHFMRPAAVMLPCSTEEVQAIVKACNRYGLKFKAHSTGWAPLAQAFAEGVIILDLRRMNGILKIDEKNMYAVIEPYVTCAQLQAECMKRGLICHTTGTGASASVLAAATSAVGNGPDSIYQGYSAEVLMGLEYVTPEGEILHTGSLTAGEEWFCGEGPGPSLRGVIRGKVGTWGAMGVFTRCAVKLALWPGPKGLPVEGIIPAYRSYLPDNFKFYTLVWPDWKRYADSIYALADSEICYIAHRQYNMMGEDLWPAMYTMFNDPTKTLDDLEDLVNDPKIKAITDEVRHYAYQIILAGMTPGDLEYQEKVLDKILADNGGHKVESLADEEFTAYSMMYLFRLPSKNINYIFGGKTQYFRPDGSPDYAVGDTDRMIEVLGRYQKTRALPQMGADSTMSTLTGIGGGGDFHFEQFVLFDKSDKDSVKSAWDCVRGAMKIGLQLTPGLPPELDGLKGQDLQDGIARVVPQPVRYHWHYKIRQMLDPNGAADSATYTVLDKNPQE